MAEPGASGWVTVDLGDLSHLADGQLRRVEPDGCEAVVVCRAGGALYALDDVCSHAEASLSEGRLRGFNLVCPLHGASFDVRDGSHTSPPAWEGVTAHEVVETGTGAVLTVRPPDRRADGPTADGSRFRTR
jgi:3-phenylpropionate/trans-cinnamate dioxygenase ferredoxin component